ncbi:response regulator [Gracilibacillus salitolerans]|uniref:Response regulator n=1 Tax=Gracilibacillus salitolerans TaxID=2663022 RepID=A0A5Q2TM23_9BACI|nr:response regulator [Gracilibacillus salitolerans]QGH36029.1 response regulator [Gracilibacillus salitolerans]
MRKVIIVDDEAQVRKGLHWKVDWEEEGFQIVAEAPNGKEALALIAENRIDLVLTDVRMPIMGGIELAKQCQENYRNTKVIVLSGYSDFEYVKNSMKEGVRDYLLKPVDPDELQEVLKRMRQEIENDKSKQLELERVQRLVRTQLQEVQEQYLLYLVKEEWLQHSIVKERLKQLKLHSLLQENVKVQFITVEVRDLIEHSNRVKQLQMTFQMLCKEIAEKQSGVLSFYDPNYTNMIHFLRLVDDSNNPSYLVKSVQHNVKVLLKLEAVIGIGNIVTGITEFKMGYISSLLSWSQSQLGTHSQVIDETVKKEGIADFSPELEKRITNAIEQTNLERFKSELELLLGETNKQSVLSFSIMSNRILFSLSAIAKKYDMETTQTQRFIWESQQAIWELNSQKRVMDHLVQLARIIIERVSNTRITDGKLIVDGVKRYLDQHYGNDVSLTALSELFHINSAYLSEIFKLQVGQNFSEYLVERRMKEAKKFLKDRHLKIIDVANLVGFSSSAYFSTVFKKHVGQTPAEYRKSLTVFSDFE